MLLIYKKMYTGNVKNPVFKSYQFGVNILPTENAKIPSNPRV
jgi:hypothetical protein